MTDESVHLLRSICAFDQWASASADQRNSDWPTDYPDFNSLVQAAASAMRAACRARNISDEEVATIARVWSLTEEPESMVDVAIAIGTAVGPILKRLYALGDLSTRWQVVTAVARIDGIGVDLIQDATQDVDAYVRLRAWDALYKIAPSMALSLAQRARETEADHDVRALLNEIVRCSY